MSESRAAKEAGEPTQWDIAFREGYSKALREGHQGQPWWTSDVTTENRHRQWVPSIALPLYGLRKKCSCGRKFWTEAGYRGHYALMHVLELP